MRDYAIGEDFCEEDDEVHSTMFTTIDPVNFVYALKSEKWRQEGEKKVGVHIDLKSIKELKDALKSEKWRQEGKKKVGVKWKE